MKTAVTVLNETMMKLGHIPEYECIAQSGPQHQATFECRCKCQGISVIGQARSKKEAKQEAAKKMLIQLNARGQPVPPSFSTPIYRPPSPPSPSNKPSLEPGQTHNPNVPTVDARSYVALLKELCEEYRMPEPVYELVGDTGPPHQRHFTMRVALGLHEQQATSTTKKAARQLAAEQLYTYLRENLARVTGDFSEEEALLRANERRSQQKRGAEAAERYAEHVEGGTRAGGEAAWRTDLGLRVADYHLGLLTHIGEEKRAEARRAVRREGGEGDEEALAQACKALGLQPEHTSLGKLAVLRLGPSSPPLAFAAFAPHAATAVALRYLRRVMPTVTGTDTTRSTVLFA